MRNLLADVTRDGNHNDKLRHGMGQTEMDRNELARNKIGRNEGGQTGRDRPDRIWRCLLAMWSTTAVLALILPWPYGVAAALFTTFLSFSLTEQD